MSDQSASGVDSTASPAATDFAAYEAAQNALDLGRDTPSSDDPRESRPAPSGDQSASTDANPAAASEPAKPDDPKPPRNLDTRHRDVDERIAELKQKLAIKRELEAQLSDRRPSATPAASQPATPTTAEGQRYAQHPDAPKAEQFETYEEFTAAQAVFIADQRYAEREQRARIDAESRARMGETESTITGFQARLAKVREADADFDLKVADGLMAFKPAFALAPGERVMPGNVLMEAIVRSEHAADLLLHFSDPQEGPQRWNAIVHAKTPADLLRAVGRVEARFEASSGSPAEEKTAAKPVTSAPAPPRTLGGKPPADPDRVGAAVKAGDFTAYQAAADAADLARLRR